MFKLGIRNLFRHKGRTALTLAAIVSGVVALILSGGFVEDLLVQLREFTIRSQVGHLQIYRADYYEHGRRRPFAYMIDDVIPLQETVTRIPHVIDVMRRINFSGLLNTTRADAPILGEGVEPEKEAQLGSLLTITEGRQLTGRDEFGILLGEGVANFLNLRPGDYVTLLSNTVDGALNSLEFEVVGVFRTFSKDYDARAVRIPLSTAQELLFTSSVHSLVVSLDDTLATNEVAQEVIDQLNTPSYEVKTWNELDDFYPKAVALYKRQFGVFQVIILVMVALSVANSVNMTIFERIGELGVIRVLGYRSRDVIKSLVVENTILGLGGSSAGVIIGIVLAAVISEAGIPMPPPPNSNTEYTAQIRLVPLMIGISFVIGTVATVLPSLLAARRATRIPLVDALRQNV